MIEISYEDIRNIYVKKKKMIWLIGFAFAIAAGGIIALKPLRFEAVASFKEGVSNQENFHLGSIKQLFDQISYSETEVLASSIMASRKCISKVIENLGLQLDVKKMPVAHFSERALRRLHALLGKGLKEIELLHFKDISYEGEEPLTFHLIVKELGVFEIEETNTLFHEGEPIQFGTASFTLERSTSLTPGERLRCIFYPMQQIIDTCLRFLVIKQKKNEKNLFELRFSHENRRIASRFLNMLMAVYKDYLSDDYASLAEAQMQYLERRQDEIAQLFDKHLQQHVDYLKSNVGAHGFFNLNQELNTFKESKKRFMDRTFDVNLILQKEKQRKNLFAEDGQMSDLGKKFVSLRMQRESLAKKLHDENQDRVYAQQKEQLLEKIFHVHLDQRSPIHNEKLLHLRNTKLHLKEEKALELGEFGGIDLDLAKTLYVDLQNALCKAEQRIKHLKYLEEMLSKKKDFELSALSAVLKDPAGQELVKRASELTGKLRDEKNLMEKDQVRLKQALSVEKDSLMLHIVHQIHLEELSKTVFQEKLKALKRAYFNLVNQEIFFLEEEMKQQQEEKVQLLEYEKALLNNKFEELNDSMTLLPEKWLMENRLQLKTELILSIMEGISQLVESKNVEHHLKHIESNPLDFAYIPSKPSPDYFILFTLLSGGFGFFSALGLFLVKGVIKGLPISETWLKKAGFSVQYVSEDLFRSIYLKREGKKLGIFSNGRPFDGKEFASFCAKNGKSVLYLPCDFSTECFKGRGYGLFHFLDGKVDKIPIQKGKFFDVLHLGYADMLGVEKLEQFEKKWADLSYDIIILHIQEELYSLNAKELYSLCDSAFLFLKEESHEHLKPYFKEQVHFLF